jgi:hypothetical protein
MTREGIIRLAREAGFSDHSSPEMWGVMVASHEEIERFAKLVAKAEREACALMAQAFGRNGYDFTGDLELHEAIRARGQ